VGPRAGLDTEVRGKILLPLTGIEPRSPGRPVRSQTLLLTELPRLLHIAKVSDIFDRSGFAPGSVLVRFVVDCVALGQVILRVLRFYPVSIIPPLLSTLIYRLGDAVVVTVQRRNLTPSA
jgi:hypothetical protein